MDTGALVQRILAAKIRLLETNTFFGLLMQHIIFAVDTECATACTDAERIYFGDKFCDKLTDDELLVVMMHELMHIVLGHCQRGAGLDNFWYNVAADVVVNSNIAKALGMPNLNVQGQTLMHLAPDGNEGRLYTAEEVYDMLTDKMGIQDKDRQEGDQKNNGRGQGAGEGSDAPKQKGTLGPGAAPLDAKAQKVETAGYKPTKEDYQNAFRDDHTAWKDADDPFVQSKWRQYVADAATVAASMGCGDATGLSDRLLQALTKPVVDWRILLNNFVQQDINDYSFMPPDRRYDSGVFLPDFNVPDQSVKDLWLVMDTSGSISTEDLARAYSEVKGAIEQFDGKLSGILSFFDTAVTEPVPFESVKDLLRITPKGGGGTSFHSVFDYYQKHLQSKRDLTGIIIFTDGYASFPSQSAAKGVPVFWLVNNKHVTPPWGIVARYLAAPKTKP